MMMRDRMGVLCFLYMRGNDLNLAFHDNPLITVDLCMSLQRFRVKWSARPPCSSSRCKVLDCDVRIIFA